MRDWNLASGAPLSLTLAADAALGPVDYANDHIWELDLGGGEPPAIGLRTTYGLRARAMRVFLRFSEQGRTLSDPLTFAIPPRVRRFHPNYLALTGAPFPALELTAEFWAPQSQVVAGRLTLVNRSVEPRLVRLDCCGLLVPMEGQGLAPTQFQMVNVLSGRTGGLAPVIFLTGGPQPGASPYPTLSLDVHLGPVASRRLTWVQAALPDPQASFDLARRVAARPWDEERARIDLNALARTVDVETGDPEWDAAFAFSQRTALGAFFPAGERLPAPSFVIARRPDHGSSRRPDGGDAPALWSGQPPLESLYLAEVLPGASDLLRGVLRNFLAAQGEDGAIDGRPGLAGQRARWLAAPLLAGLAWRLYRRDGDLDFLREAFPRLADFVRVWFQPAHDRDGDGVPEWDHLLQTGIDDHPAFALWHGWSQAADITATESPALSAMLIREIDCLAHMAAALGQPDAVADLVARADVLRAALDECWSARAGIFLWRDRDTHASQPGKLIGRQRGDGMLRVKRNFDPPVRLLVQVQTGDGAARRPRVVLREFITRSGADEVLDRSDFQWSAGGATATSRMVFSRLGAVEVSGLQKGDRLTVRVLDLSFQEISQFLPLWAGVLDEARARDMLKRALLRAGRFDRPYGLPLCAAPPAGGEIPGLAMHLPWNTLICAGMLRAGFRQEAARLLVHLMTAVVQSLKQSHAFAQAYHSEPGAGMGERNAVSGLAPLGLFLDVLGVEFLPGGGVRLSGANPFPWPVTVSLRGLRVRRASERSEVTFPDGRTVAVDDPSDCQILP